MPKIFFQLKKNPYMDSEMGGCFGVLIVTYLFTLDNPPHPSVSAYLSVKLGAVLTILPNTVIVEINWWISVQYSTLYKGGVLHVLQELPSVTHMHLSDLKTSTKILALGS